MYIMNLQIVEIHVNIKLNLKFPLILKRNIIIWFKPLYISSKHVNYSFLNKQDYFKKIERPIVLIKMLLKAIDT